MYEYTTNGIHITKDKEQKGLKVHLHVIDIVADTQLHVLLELPLVVRHQFPCIPLQKLSQICS